MRALNGIETEVFVVDNHSDDDSVKMVSLQFPSVHIIENQENCGFSKANNQAIKLSKGEYILLLNPDTVIEEDALEKAILFMDQQPKAGGLGVKMIDSRGKFLPESKRGLPTPWASFCKMSYLSTLFPRSRSFNQYHLGFLSENQIHKVDVLAGAFMFLRKSVLDTIGFLDEDFFMYGEDIDLSYRITQAGFSNYYFPKSRIIHYKGESTRKSSLNYVKMFYGSMLIFARKHFAARNKWLLSLVIMPGVYLRASSAYLHRLFENLMRLILLKEKQDTDSKMNIIDRNYLNDRPVSERKKIVVIAREIEYHKILELLNFYYINSFSPEIVTAFNSTFSGATIIPKETDFIIFSAEDMTVKEMINIMESVKKYSIQHYIAYTDRKVVIRSGYVFDGN
jgi:GT2 family glycosyltransferase